MTCLKTVQVNDEIFNNILSDFEFKVEIKEDLFNYYTGYYEDRESIYYNGKDEFICLECIVNMYTDLFNSASAWKQVRVLRSINTSAAVQTVSGSKAKAYITKVLRDFYTPEEIDQRLRMFEADYDPEYKQQHLNYEFLEGQESKVVKIAGTYKFDINGAHLDALCEIFPKASAKFLTMYEKRKVKKVFKHYPNLYVGMLAYKSKAMREQGIPGVYEKTYNWIVQRTTRMLLNAIDSVGGSLIYVNTDGFIVQAPENIICTSKNLGDFKLEFAGNTYVYEDKNYIVYQTGEEPGDECENIKGSCFTAVRPNINLAKGEVVHYDIKAVKNTAGKILFREPANITKEKVNIYEA